MKKIVKITTISILSLIILLFLIMTLGIVITNKPQMQRISYEPATPDYWPTQGWQKSTPEEQGMDSAKLLEMVEFYEKQHLEIKDIQWEKSPQGIDIGWARMWLKPHDMAKIGLLYLQKGRWESQQIIPARWIEESLTAHSLPKKYRYVYNEKGKVDRITSGGIWMFTNLARPFAEGYGYQWWLDKSGKYSAVGAGGQFIMVLPRENLVVVFASKLSGTDSFFSVKMLDKYILSAIVSNESIDANETAQYELSLLSEPPSQVVKPQPLQQLPAMTLEISDETYSLDSNPWKYNNFELIFDPEKDKE